MTLTLPAPAKLNLFLHITGRRADGYHLLQTVFRLLDYSDTLHLTWRNDTLIERVAGNESISAHEDLIVRAARLLQQHCGIKQGVSLAIEKKIPMGGGLGGGSSNAATVLVGLNQLWHCGLSQAELAALGLRLGADVPVFVRGHSAWAEGVGEQLTSVDLPECWYLVVAPNESVSTAKIFATEGLTRNCEPCTMATFLRGETQNVFEPIVRKQYSAVDQVFLALAEYGKVRLTGTGACVFIEFLSQKEALAIQEKLTRAWFSFVAKGVNVSPLLK